MSEKYWQIFGLGTNNWQSAEEPAPGSGILHEGHHLSFNLLSGVSSYSIWPSNLQKNKPGVIDHRIFELPHNIPICESCGPISTYRWHSMSEEEVSAYRSRLVKETMEYMEEVEAKTGRLFNLFIAHHCFMNPTILIEINGKRMASGKPRVPIVVFAHGTALKMFQNEIKKEAEFPMRFWPWMNERRVFEDDEDIVGVFAIGNSQKATFNEVFPNYPLEKVQVTPNGYNQTIFKPEEGATKESVLGSGRIPPFFYEGFDPSTLEPAVREGLGITQSSDGGYTLPTAIPNAAAYDKIVLFTGRFADWKRIDVVLGAAKIYTAESAKKGIKVMTLLAGTGPLPAQKKFIDMAYQDFKLNNAWYVGAQPQPNLSLLNTISDVGLYPSKDEPFGLVFIECMACGTPVIGANSGGPIDFVVPEVGVLVEESEDHSVLMDRVSAAVLKSFDEKWKETRGSACVSYAKSKFSLIAQCEKMLTLVQDVLLIKTVKPAAPAEPKFP